MRKEAATHLANVISDLLGLPVNKDVASIVIEHWVSPEPERTLFDAIQHDDVESVTSIVYWDLTRTQLNVKPNEPLGPRFNEAVGFAISRQCEHIVSLLLSARVEGFDVNVRSGDASLLYQACDHASPNERIIALLLAIKGIDVNQGDRTTGCTPLVIACFLGQVGVVALLLAADGIDVNMADSTTERTPLQTACYMGNFDVVLLLLSADGLDLSKDANALLRLACQNQYEGIVHMLVADDAINVNLLHPKEHCTLLYTACSAEETNENIVKSLLAAKNIDVNKGQSNGHFPLMVACNDSNESIVVLLLQAKGINVNLALKTDGSTALFSACQLYCDKIVRHLLAAKDIDVNKSDNYGTTPLLTAVQNNRPSNVKLLLAAKGISVNTADKTGNTPLLQACEAGYCDDVRLLLECDGIEVNQADGQGISPLHRAVLFNRKDVVDILLRVERIDVNQASKDGLTNPLTSATCWIDDARNIRAALVAAGAREIDLSWTDEDEAEDPRELKRRRLN